MGERFLRIAPLIAAIGLTAVPLARLLTDSLGGWSDALSLRQLPGAIAGTLALSAAAAALALLAGGAAALTLARRRVPGERAWRLALSAPALLPQTVIAAAWVIAAERPGAPWTIYSPVGLILVVAACALPVVFLLLEDAFARQDPALEDAARALGADERAVLRRVIIPGAAAPAASAGLLALLTAASAFGPQAIIGLPAGIWTLPNLLYTRWSLYHSPPSAVSALALLLLATAAPAALLLPRAGRILALAPRPDLKPARARAGLVSLSFLGALVLTVTVVPYGALLHGSMDASSWSEVAASALWRGAFARSLFLAACAAAAGAALGFLLAAFTARTRDRNAALADAAGTWPAAWSATALAAAWSTAAGPIGAPPGVLLLSIYFLRALPPAYLAVRGAVDGAPRALEDAARACGAGAVLAARSALWPVARPALAGAAALAFAASFREIEASVLLAAPGAHTFGTAAFSAWNGGDIRAMCAGALSGAALSATAVAIILRAGKPI